MPLPDNKNFNDFLCSLTLHYSTVSTEANDFEKIEVIPERILTDYSGTKKSNSINILQHTSSVISVEAFLRKLSDELREKGHISTVEMAKVILAMSCITSEDLHSPITRLNTILQMIGQANVSQFWIASYPSHPDFCKFSIGRFTIGKIDRQKLIHRCKKVGCDFFAKYPSRYKDNFSIEGAPVSFSILDWDDYQNSFKLLDRGMVGDLLDYYFEYLTGISQDRFCKEFRVAQEVIVVAGAPYIDLENPWSLGRSSFIAIYQKIGKKKLGYFCPFERTPSINFSQANQRFPAKIEELKSKYLFTELGDYEIHKTLNTFCRFVVKAIVNESEKRWDEAFLHYVIALDLLFGEKESSTQSVTRRTAIIVSKALEKNPAEILAQMKIIYNMRSKYVHEGAQISNQDIDLVRPIINEVFLCLLRLQSDSSNLSEGFINKWLKRLDFFIAADEAGEDIEDSDLLKAGIAISASKNSDSNLDNTV